jgi:DNA invertase Pin-like site-specific DNA recombinase
MSASADSHPRRRRRAVISTPGVLGYLRVSTDEQAASGLGLAAQRAAIVAECARRGLVLIDVMADEGVSGSVLDRPGLASVLDRLDRGEASVLMVAKLDRLTRSVEQAYALMDQSRRSGWALVALDLGVDTTTPAGEMMAGVASVFAQFERRLISQRTRDALAVIRAQGVQLGRPRTVGADARARIVELRATGLAWQAVADTMASERWATGQGGRWLANTCRRIALADDGAAA